MCVIDWNSTCGRPIECSRRCSKVRPSIPVPPLALLRKHAPFTGRVDDDLLDPIVAPVQEPLRGGVTVVVVVGPEVVEEAVGAPARLGAEQRGELARGLGALGL